MADKLSETGVVGNVVNFAARFPQLVRNQGTLAASTLRRNTQFNGGTFYTVKNYTLLNECSEILCLG